MVYWRTQNIIQREDYDLNINKLKGDIDLIKTDEFKTLDELNRTSILKEYFDVPEKTMTAFEHIFLGRHDNDSIVGYHSEILYPNRYGQDDVEANQKIDKTRPYNLYLPSGKVTSCFSITMNINDILKIILFAYKQAWIEQKPKIEATTGWNPVVYSPELCANIQLKTGTKQKIYDAYPQLGNNN